MNGGSGKGITVRLRLVFLAFSLVFIAFLYKAIDLQVVKRDFLVAKASREIDRHLSLGAVRGDVFDVQGERLATSVAMPTLWADPAIFKDDDRIEEVASALEAELGIDRAETVKAINDKRRKRYAVLKRHLTPEEVSTVKGLKFRELALQDDYKRVYPNGFLASHFLGVVGAEGKGLEGLELALDDQLQPGREKLKAKRDAGGRRMLDTLDVDVSQARGASVVLTIDRRIQHITEKALARSVEEFKAKSGMALVVRPKTGEVLASAVWPNFDPNNYGAVDISKRRNRILTDPFEPGSTFKVFVVAAALEEGLINPETVIYCENGAFRVANHTVKDTHSYGDLTVSQVIKHSSNIGSLKVGAMLGNERLYNYLTRFSFGARTGLANMTGESPGDLRDPKNPKTKWHPVDAANIAFGQGVSVTALQMVMGMSALANDGVMMKPYIIDRVLDADGSVIQQNEPHILRQVVSPMTARQVAAMLRMAVQKGGTATRAEVEGYPVAGKTGTAQKVQQGTKGYAAGKYVSSFIGFAPYHDPQLCVMIILDEPQNRYYGGTVATPAFKEIMENSLPLLDIPPTEEKGDPVWPLLVRNGGGGAPGVLAGGQPTNFVRVKFKKGDRGDKGPITIAALGHGQTLAAAGEAPSAVFNDISSVPEAYPGIMPDLTGLSMRQVLELMGDYGMDLEYVGSGLVVSQAPAPGAEVANGQIGTIFFERN